MERNTRPEHRPLGDPCRICRLPAAQHRTRPKRVEHTYVGHGVTCEQCQLGIRQHFKREKKDKTDKTARQLGYAGIDGEGQGASPHRYTMLAACDESGAKNWYVENPNGLTTEQCLDFILSIPLRYRCFAYGFNYDLSKMLEDLPNSLLYFLFRPELRQRLGKKKGLYGPRPIKWNGYSLNLQGTKFTVTRDGRERVIWDIWKFYQSKFTGALKLWNVGTVEAVEKMQEMKDKRSQFDKMPHDAVRAYCLEECQYMATLARKLVEAHEAAGLKLKSFYGAGSSATAMLEVMGIRSEIRPPPDFMKEAIAMAFSGGRFENSLVGTVKGVIHGKDISSAYPYQLCFLPCLVHAHWQRTNRRRDIESARTALVRYRLRATSKKVVWGPFPFRGKDGSICYPSESGGGWVWRDEYLVGERLFDNVQFVEAFIMNADCDCTPFKQIPSYYVERCRIGKSGPGIVIKLGSNSVYGKLAQHVGHKVFTSWMWAGLTTSGCRAQILEMLGLHSDRENLLMIATDGIHSLEDIQAPLPRNTGTDVAFADGKGKLVSKPLGGWESDTYEQGVFYARPGIYFPLNPTKDDLDDIKARGIGRAALLDNWQSVIETWERDGVAGKVKLATLSRFVGAKTSISRDKDNTFRRALGYGEWIPYPTDMTFNPLPKRERILKNGKLEVRKMPLDLVSAPYIEALDSPESSILQQLEQMMEEQPDLGFSSEEIYE